MVNKVIELEGYHYQCGDGCCEDWGWNYRFIEDGKVVLDGSEYSQKQALVKVLEHLGITINETYE